MIIGLIHIDGKLPNLALMKLSAWYKAQGHGVELLTPADVLKGQSLFGGWDKLYGATVFTDSRPIAEHLARIGVEVGGTGWDLVKRLPPEVEAMKPDYDLYGIDYGIGFLSKGCIRRCEFCVVWRKEPELCHVAWPLELLNPKSKRLVILDNIFNASPMWKEKAAEIIFNKLEVDFTQGMDIRQVDKEQAKILVQMKHSKRVHFAFDDPTLVPSVTRGIEHLLTAGFHPDKLSFFVLTNFNTTFEQDMSRIKLLLGYGVNPFVMIYNRSSAPREIRDLARWCNRPALRKTCTFDEYRRVS